MFGKLNESATETHNQKVDDSSKGSLISKESLIEKTGQVSTFLGSMSTLVAGMGAGSLLLSLMMGASGLSLLLSTLVFLGIGILFLVIGSRMNTGNWIPDLRTV